MQPDSQPGVVDQLDLKNHAPRQTVEERSAAGCARMSLLLAAAHEVKPNQIDIRALTVFRNF
jgi:hypothetical protein